MRGVYIWLMKTAYTGTAACLIGGRTMHDVACLSIRGEGQKFVKAKQKMERLWEQIELLIIDEDSMISKVFFTKFFERIQVA